MSAYILFGSRILFVKIVVNIAEKGFLRRMCYWIYLCTILFAIKSDFLCCHRLRTTLLSHLYPAIVPFTVRCKHVGSNRNSFGNFNNILIRICDSSIFVSLSIAPNRTRLRTAYCLSGCFGSWFPKLSRAAAISCGFSAKQSDNATSRTSKKSWTSATFHYFVQKWFDINSAYLRLSSARLVIFDHWHLPLLEMMLAVVRQSVPLLNPSIMTGQTLPDHQFISGDFDQKKHRTTN